MRTAATIRVVLLAISGGRVAVAWNATRTTAAVSRWSLQVRLCGCYSASEISSNTRLRRLLLMCSEYRASHCFRAVFGNGRQRLHLWSYRYRIKLWHREMVREGRRVTGLRMRRSVLILLLVWIPSSARMLLLLLLMLL
jgi:hypothetical protein